MVGELRDQALEDLQADLQSEFGQTIKISREDGSDPKDFIGDSNDIGVRLDTDTGLMITGTSAQAILVLKEVLDHFGALPQRLWQIEFLDLTPQKLRIKDVMPDATAGVLVLTVGNSDVN